MAIINKDINTMALPLSIRRGNPFPVDESTVWYDKGQMESYAREGATAYVGQVLVCVNENESTVEAYVIQNAAGNLMKLATSTASGDLAADVLALQGKVTNLEKAVGTKPEGSGIVANEVWAALDEIEKAYKAADTQINETLTTNYYDKNATDNKIDEKVNAKISSAYKAAGSVIFSALPQLAETEEGKVYNISEEFTTNENFVEGAGKSYPAGTNIVCVDTGEKQFKWDVLAGFVNLSPYETTAAVDEKLAKKVNVKEGSSLVEDTDIAKLKGLANIKSVEETELNLGEDGKLGIKAIDSTKVTGLNDALEGKVDKVPGSSLVQDTLITKLTDLANIKTTSAELEVTSEGELGIKAIAQSKVTGLTAALEEKIKEIKTGETALQAEAGVVTIPAATAEALGLVKSAEGANHVTVDTNGVMSVHSLEADKLVNGKTALILNGGTSSIE